MPNSEPTSSWSDSLSQISEEPPADDELEVSIFGPGYGECVVLHIGQGEWIVVDSCVSAEDHLPIAPKYLSSLGVDPRSAVKLIVATHWHDDHVRGIADVVSASPDAVFACPVAVHSKDFITLTEATRADLMMKSSGVDELRWILDNIPPSHLLFASERSLLYSRNSVDVIALTPSSTAIRAALQDIARMLPSVLTPKRRIAPVGPNHASVVLWVRVGSTHLLLGADLQEVPGNHWTAVLQSPNKPTGQADLFKIPHHGSPNADQPSVWSQLVKADAIALLCPNQRGSVSLPSQSDVARICSYERDTYITAKAERRRFRHENRTVDRTIGDVVTMTEANAPMGHVRVRKKIDSETGWQVVTFNRAYQLCA